MVSLLRFEFTDGRKSGNLQKRSGCMSATAYRRGVLQWPARPVHAHSVTAINLCIFVTSHVVQDSAPGLYIPPEHNAHMVATAHQPSTPDYLEPTACVF